MAVERGPEAAESPTARRRRRPDEARREILDAARDLLMRGPAHEATVAAIMARTTLSRKSFYVYFRDRSELLEALVRPLRVEADGALDAWRTTDDAVVAGRRALASAARLYREHGAILRAVFWSSSDDPEVDRARAGLADGVVDVAESIIARIAPGLRDPSATATALVTMNIHSMLAITPQATDAELEALVDTLATIWERVLLGTTAASQDPTAHGNGQ